MMCKLLLVLATFSVALSSLEENWQTFVDPEGKFEVRFPDSVSTSSKTVSTPIGDLNCYTLVSKERLGADENVYQLRYCDYPAGMLHPDSSALIEDFFEVTIAESVESVEGELLYVDDLNRREPSKLWKVTSEKYGLHFKNRAILVGDRLYNFQVVTTPENSLKSKSDEFFDSFKLKT